MAAPTTLTGNLTREPEIRYTKEGIATTTMGIAVNRRRQVRETGAWEDETSFFDVVCFRELAENVALSLTKGSRVVVSGRLSQRSWTDAEGANRSRVEVAADDVGASLKFATAEVTKAFRRSDAAGSDDEQGSTPTSEEASD
jgi:single-strand DNA-binding protein